MPPKFSSNAPKIAQKKLPEKKKEEEKKKKRYKPGELAIREIRRYQRTSNLLLPKLSFARVVKEICEQIAPDIGLRWRTDALEALQEASEHYLVHLFEDA